MARAKRTTLPKDFEERLGIESPADLIGVFDRCEVDARGGYSGATAIGFPQCPDALVRWLVAHGADVDAADRYGTTPLQRRAGLGRTEQLGLMLELGAGLEVMDAYGRTALDRAAVEQRPEALHVLLAAGARVRGADHEEPTLLLALRTTRNVAIPRTAEVASLLLDAGTAVTEPMRREVVRIGTELEFHRQGFARDGVAQVDAGLAELYRLFQVPPVPARVVPDRAARIEVPDGPWQRRHQALWELLVPSSGAAPVAQGEVVRITGRLSHEILDDGGGNWDAEFRSMLQALEQHLGSGAALPSEALREVHRLVRSLRRGRGEEAQLMRLSELAVDWVARNPDPMPIEAPAYRR